MHAWQEQSRPSFWDSFLGFAKDIFEFVEAATSLAACVSTGGLSALVTGGFTSMMEHAIDVKIVINVVDKVMNYDLPVSSNPDIQDAQRRVRQSKTKLQKTLALTNYLAAFQTLNQKLEVCVSHAGCAQSNEMLPDIDAEQLSANNLHEIMSAFSATFKCSNEYPCQNAQQDVNHLTEIAKQHVKTVRNWIEVSMDIQTSSAQSFITETRIQHLERQEGQLEAATIKTSKDLLPVLHAKQQQLWFQAVNAAYNEAKQLAYTTLKYMKMCTFLSKNIY